MASANLHVKNLPISTKNSVEICRFIRNLELNKAKTIIVRDNCGGFDVNDISEGKSSKSDSENGVFLKLLMNVNVQELLGISFEIISNKGYTSAILNIK